VTENLALAPMHEVRLDRIAVVVADEMQRAVGGEEIELERQGHTQATRLPRRRVGAEDQLADERPGAGRLERKGQHVGPPADAAMDGVELADLGVAHDGRLDEAARPADRRQRPVDGAAQPRGRDRHAALALLDDSRHQADPARAPSSRSAPRASWAPYARMIAETSWWRTTSPSSK
jgi:hypothetical protein